MLTDTILENDSWQDTDLATLAERAATLTLTHLGLPHEPFEIAVLGCDDARIAALNAEFRGKPVATNVLSWPASELHPADTPEIPPAGELGDIALAYETCLREARELGKPLTDHVTHLIVHGTLHLLGYDHAEEAEATRMEGLETAILARLGLPDPYA